MNVRDTSFHGDTTMCRIYIACQCQSDIYINIYIERERETERERQRERQETNMHRQTDRVIPISPLKFVHGNITMLRLNRNT